MRTLDTGDKAHKRSKHARWHSIETLENVIGEKATSVVRRSLDVPWLGRFKHHSPLTTPEAAANVAKIFARMVCPSPFP